MDRRKFLRGAGATAVAVASASSIWKALASGEADDALINGNLALLTDLEVVCDLVIPDTDTAGAKTVGVPRWLLLAAEHELEGADGTTLPRFVALLNEPAEFSRLDAEAQRQRLTEIDTRALVDRADDELSGLWRTVKALIVMGYYTSEVGASEELRYELVPGRWIPAAEIDSDQARAWSSDWLAVKL